MIPLGERPSRDNRATPNAFVPVSRSNIFQSLPGRLRNGSITPGKILRAWHRNVPHLKVADEFFGHTGLVCSRSSQPAFRYLSTEYPADDHFAPYSRRHHQAQQGYLRRCVTITRNCAGTTSSRFDVSSPTTCIGAGQQGAVGVLRLNRHIDMRQVADFDADRQSTQRIAKANRDRLTPLTED
jgi:hypothetical protein